MILFDEIERTVENRLKDKINYGNNNINNTRYHRL